MGRVLIIGNEDLAFILEAMHGSYANTEDEDIKKYIKRCVLLQKMVRAIDKD